MRCNTLLTQASKDQVRDQLPVQVAVLHDEFLRCPDCGRVYWKGGHFRHMGQWIDASTQAPVVAGQAYGEMRAIADRPRN
jgi:hypothetical protein